MEVYGQSEHDIEPKRPVGTAFLRGMKGRCPCCGNGKLFAAFTEAVPMCQTCGEDLSHQRADDFPAYLVIFIVGHIVLASYLLLEMVVNWTAFQHLALWLPLTAVLSILLLQPIKGAVIGLWWALRMHGFGGEAVEGGSVS